MSSIHPTPSDADGEVGELPAVRHARRETLVALSGWVAAMVYSVSYCGAYGYGRSPEDLKFIWGMPDWIFGGVFLPWCISTAFSIWFALGWMRRDPLGVERENALDALMEVE